jgi:dimethylhistidine N-methyltransferase
MHTFPLSGAQRAFHLAGLPVLEAVPDAGHVLPADPQAALRAELAAGLLSPFARIAPKFLYDKLGSSLFEAICQLPEYYPTRTEAAIFDAHLAEIARAAGPDTVLIDLGAGNCRKAARLFPALRPHAYVPVDISAEFLFDAVARLKSRFPAIAMQPLGLDFSATLALPDSVPQARRLFFYPGSSIGNFSPVEALALLRRMRAACAGDGGLLIGVDLIKDKATLDRAYDDALGVTAAFNLNVLRHANELLGADFDVGQWRHRGFFNRELGRVEMHLEARTAVDVSWPGARRRFVAGERIHTENSYKYTIESFVDTLSLAGFADARVWLDEDRRFAVAYARAG